MNFFIFDKDTFTNAKAYCLEHRRKMILEYSQILSTCFWKLEYEEQYSWEFLKNKETKTENQKKYKDETGLYIPTHINHPVVKWAMESYGNRKLIYNTLYYLLELFHKSKGDTHKTEEVFPHLTDLIVKDKMRGGRMTVPPKCMPDEYKLGGDTLDDVVLSYRNYMVNGKDFKMTWEEIPEWYTSAMKANEELENIIEDVKNGKNLRAIDEVFEDDTDKSTD